MVDLNSARMEDHNLRVNCGWYFLTGQAYSEQTNLDKSEVWEARSAGLSVLTSGSKPICLLVSHASQTNGNYSMSAKKKLTELLCFENRAVLACSAIFKHGYLHHGGCGWRISHSLQHHIYLITSTYVLKDAVGFVSGPIIPAIKQPEPDSQKKESEISVGGISGPVISLKWDGYKMENLF